MRVLLILMIAAAAAGCSVAAITQTPTDQVAVSVAARTLGYKISEADPAIIGSAKIYCQTLLSGNVNQALVDSMRSFLADKFKDPLLAASMTDLFTLVKVNNVYAPELVKTAAASALDGISLYEQAHPAAGAAPKGQSS